MSTTQNTVSIRRARPGDAATIAQIHVASWIETYTSLLSQDFMDNLMSVEDRATYWTRALNGKKTKTAIFIAINHDQQTVGFISCGPQRLDQFSNHQGEIYAIYILRKAQRTALGRALIERAALFLRDNKISSVSCLVLGANEQACLFYEALGGQVIGELIDERPTGLLTEIAYGWNDLSVFYRNMPATGNGSIQGETDAP